MHSTWCHRRVGAVYRKHIGYWIQHYDGRAATSKNNTPPVKNNYQLRRIALHIRSAQHKGRLYQPAGAKSDPPLNIGPPRADVALTGP